MAPSCGSENETKGEHIQRCRTGTKPHSTPLTLKWLEENYEIAEGVCIPRNALYMHYLDYCSKNDTQPVNAASFGKIIRQQFSHITTRRLGTRGQSKYHYYGIGVKETSHYYDAMYSAKNVQGYGNGKRETSRQDVPYLQIMAFSPRSKLGTLLPDFPDIKDLKLPPNVPEDKVLTFLMMYRTHCQRILDTVIRANFDEVSDTVHLNREILPNIQSFLVHFWQGMPQHLLPLLNINAIVTLVGVCDSILYKAIASVLMPSVLQALPESLTQVIRKFARQLDDWLNYALYSLPENLCKVKFDLARRFCQLLRRQTSLNHLCQAARTVTQNREITSQMSEDWLNIDLNSIVKQTLYTMDHYSEKDHKTIANLCREFERLLEDQAPVECYLEWLDTMVDRCVVKPSKKQAGSLRTVARQFLLMWSCFGTRVIRDMTLQSSPSFGSFHLLHLMFDDYVLYLVENLHCQERASEFLRNIRQSDTSIVDFGEELMPSSLNFNDGLSSQSGNMTPPVGNSVQRPMERCSVITNGRDVMSQVGDYSCQRNVNEVSHVNQSHSPIHDNSQPVTIKSAYSSAADSSRSNSSNPSMQPTTQNALPVTPVNHISSCSPTYQQCQSYHMAYGPTLTNQHPVNMDTQNSHSMYSYDVSSQYPRHYLSAAAASVAPSTEPIKTNVTSLTPTNRQNVLSSGAAAEWPADSTASGSNRYNTTVMPHESVLRNNDNSSYTAYQTMRTPSATYDYSTYTYPDNYSRAAAVTVVPNTTPTPDAVSPHVYHPHHHHQHHQQQQQQQQQQQHQQQQHQPTSYDGNAHMNSSSTHNNTSNSNSNSRSSSSNSNISNNSSSNNNSSNANTHTTNSNYYDDSSRVDYCVTAKRKYESHQDTFSRHYKRYNREQYPYQVTSGGYM